MIRSTELDKSSRVTVSANISRKELTLDLIPNLDWKSAEAFNTILQESYLSRTGKPNTLEPHLLVSENRDIRLAFTWSCKCHSTSNA